MSVLRASDLILAGAQRIRSPAAWTQNAGARDRAGREVQWRAGPEPLPGAVAWCYGFSALDGRPDGVDAAPLVHALAAGIGEPQLSGWWARAQAISRWNDQPGRTHAEVLEALRRAFRFARQAERAR